MTCIIGLKDKDIIYMAGDSAGVCVDTLAIQIRKDMKVFRKKGYVIGFTSSFRMGQILNYNVVFPIYKKTDKITLHEFMVTKFVSVIRKAFKIGGYTSIQNNTEHGGFFLVGYKGCLFEIQCDFQVAELSSDYHAVGCGDGLALGSMYSTKGVLEPLERLHIGLRAAAEYSGGVTGPFFVVNSKNAKVEVLGA